MRKARADGGRVRIQAIRAALAAALGVALVLAAGPGQAWAKPGFYFGIGAAEQTLGGDFDGTRAFSDPSGSPTFIAGKMGAGSGTAAQIGYGFGRHFGLEYFTADTQHKATSTLTPNRSNAEFVSQVIGARFSAPFSERFEGFVRVGYGLYEMDFNNYSKNAQNVTGKVAFTGTGTAVGAGFEIFFQELGIGLGYTEHNYTVAQAKPAGGRSLGLSPALTGSASTTDLMFSIHF